MVYARGPHVRRDSGHTCAAQCAEVYTHTCCCVHTLRASTRAHRHEHNVDAISPCTRSDGACAHRKHQNGTMLIFNIDGRRRHVRVSVCVCESVFYACVFIGGTCAHLTRECVTHAGHAACEHYYVVAAAAFTQKIYSLSAVLALFRYTIRMHYIFVCKRSRCNCHKSAFFSLCPAAIRTQSLPSAV